MCRSAGPPADNSPCICVDDEGHIDEARPGCDAGEIRYLQHVRCRGVELAIDVIQRARRSLVADGRAHRLASDHPLKAHLLH
jgi:hypothetical protein